MSLKTLHDLHRPLGSTGLNVSPLGLGTVKLGRDRGVKYPSGFRIPDDQQAQMLLRMARDMGINLIDTAPAYGTSEERPGPLLRGQRQTGLSSARLARNSPTASRAMTSAPPIHAHR